MGKYNKDKKVIWTSFKKYYVKCFLFLLRGTWEWFVKDVAEFLLPFLNIQLVLIKFILEKKFEECRYEYVSYSIYVKSYIFTNY